MADEIQKKPDNIVPITEVNQYGDRSLHADHIDNLNVEVNVFNNQGSASKDENGKPYVPITPTRYDSASRTVFWGNETVKLPVELVPQSAIALHELPYIDALCEVYAEKISQAVTPDTIDTLSPGLRRNYAEQRKAYYSAESVQYAKYSPMASNSSRRLRMMRLMGFQRPIMTSDTSPDMIGYRRFSIR